MVETPSHRPQEGVVDMKFGQIMQARRSRVIAAVFGTLLLVATVGGGIAWAFGSLAKGKAIQQAATYHVVLPSGVGEREVTWTVGRATVVVTCGVGVDEAPAASPSAC